VHAGCQWVDRQNWASSGYARNSDINPPLEESDRWVLTESETRNRTPSGTAAAEIPEKDTKAVSWQCPACHATQPSEVAECPACGVVVAKFQGRRPAEGLHDAPGPDTRPRSSRLLIGVVSGIVLITVAWAGWLFWPKHGTDEPRSTSLDTRPHSTMTAEKEAGIERGELMELHYSPKGFPMGLSVSQGFALHLFETPSPNQGFKKMPPQTGAKRYYDEFRIAGSTFLVISEGSNPPRIYLDANRNGDLSDDPGPFAGEGPNIVPNHYTLSLPYKQEKTGVPYRMWMFGSAMGGVRFYPQCHWRGQLDINGEEYTLVLFDGNADGDYSNDPAVIDIDKDGRASANEKIKPGQSLSVNGTELKLLSIAPSGRWMRIER
jgi:hypothetical protein